MSSPFNSAILEQEVGHIKSLVVASSMHKTSLYWRYVMTYPAARLTCFRVGIHICKTEINIVTTQCIAQNYLGTSTSCSSPTDQDRRYWEKVWGNDTASEYCTTDSTTITEPCNARLLTYGRDWNKFKIIIAHHIKLSSPKKPPKQQKTFAIQANDLNATQAHFHYSGAPHKLLHCKKKPPDLLLWKLLSAYVFNI